VRKRAISLLVLVPLLFATSTLYASPRVASFCLPYLTSLARSLKGEVPVRWPSAYLRGRPLWGLPPDAAKARVREIVEAVYDENSALGREMDAYFSKEMAEGSKWLEKYYRAYEMFYFSPPYLDVVRRVNEHLPKTGAILDIGSGTGGLAQLLLMGSGQRHLSLLDHEVAMRIAKERMEILFPGEAGRFDYHPHYLNPVRPVPVTRKHAGGIINHTLYAMQPKVKANALRGMRANMEPGSTLVVNEPLKETAGTPDGYQKWMTHVLEEAAANGSPHSDFDVAMITALASGRLTKALRGSPLQRPLLTETEHEALFLEAGFEVVSKEPTYDGFSRLWVLRAK